MVNITGTLIWYYYICKREVWLMSHQIEPAQDHTNIEIGRVIQMDSYTREKKEIKFDDMVIDVLSKRGGDTIVAEIKKSSRYKRSSQMQLAFYLWKLKEKGLNLKGELRFPIEKKKIGVQLTPDIEQELDNIYKEISKICDKEKPPELEKTIYCRNCGYYELCWV